MQRVPKFPAVLLLMSGMYSGFAFAQPGSEAPTRPQQFSCQNSPTSPTSPTAIAESGSETVPQAIEQADTEKPSPSPQARTAPFRNYIREGARYFQAGRFAEAERYFKQAYALGVKENDIKEQCLGLHDIATIRVQTGRYKEAEAYCLKILQIARTENLGDQLTLSQVKINLADIYGKEREYDKSEALYKRILLESPKTREGELTAINALGGMGVMLHNKGSVSEALACYKEAIERCNRLNPVPESALVQNLNNLAPIYISMNKPQLAYEISSRALPLAKKLFGETGNSTVVAYNNLGSALLLMDHFAAAEEIFKQSLAAIDRSSSVKIGTKIECINDLGCACLKEHRWKEALGYLKTACDLCATAGPSQSVMLTQSLINLGTAYNRAGDDTAADEIFKKAIAAAAESGNATSKMKAQKYYDAFLKEHHRMQ